MLIAAYDCLLQLLFLLAQLSACSLDCQGFVRLIQDILDRYMEIQYQCFDSPRFFKHLLNFEKQTHTEKLDCHLNQKSL
ncbi:hypothetical protein EV424DRAFT_1357344 [Suillus variegatus]|nr:hypothetical protein EV424DRAFT_1357344 [Suillus variegatus]